VEMGNLTPSGYSFSDGREGRQDRQASACPMPSPSETHRTKPRSVTSKDPANARAQIYVTLDT